MDPREGYCVHIISGTERTIDEEHKFEEKTWWEQRPSMIQVPASSWAEIKAFIIKVCKVSGSCQKEVKSWDRSIKNIDEKIVEKTGEQ